MQTPGSVPPAPTNVQALSTSETSVEVWWDEVDFFDQILGYQVLYTQTAVEDRKTFNDNFIIILIGLSFYIKLIFGTKRKCR